LGGAIEEETAEKLGIWFLNNNSERGVLVYFSEHGKEGDLRRELNSHQRQSVCVFPIQISHKMVYMNSSHCAVLMEGFHQVSLNWVRRSGNVAAHEK
jgi:hypothetical protein